MRKAVGSNGAGGVEKVVIQKKKVTQRHTDRDRQPEKYGQKQLGRGRQLESGRQRGNLKR